MAPNRTYFGRGRSARGRMRTTLIDTIHQALAAFVHALSEDRSGAALKRDPFPLLFGFSFTRIRPEQSRAVESNGNSKATPQNTRPAIGAERFINL